MLHRCLAWSGMTMLSSFLPFLIFLLGMSVGCHGQGNEKRPPLSSDTTTVATKPQGAYKGLVHQYGPYVLKQLDERFLYEFRNDSAHYYIKEDFPGILIHERKPVSKSYVSENTTMIEYYDVNTHQLKKQIDLEKITPYNKSTYQEISISGLDYESMEIYEPDYNCIWPKLPKPSFYYTHNRISSISASGHVCANFELLKMASPNNVVGWEQTLIVFDSQGKEINRFKFYHTVYSPIVTKDGKYLVFSYGGHSNLVQNPFEPCEAVMEIYDLKNGKMILQHIGEKNSAPSEFREDEGLIYSRFFTPITTQSEQMIVDLSKREMKIYKFTWTKPLLPAWNEYKVFLDSLPFQTSKF